MSKLPLTLADKNELEAILKDCFPDASPKDLSEAVIAAMDVQEAQQLRIAIKDLNLCPVLTDCLE